MDKAGLLKLLLGEPGVPRLYTVNTHPVTPKLKGKSWAVIHKDLEAYWAHEKDTVWFKSHPILGEACLNSVAVLCMIHPNLNIKVIPYMPIYSQDASTDLSKCIPLRLYFDGAEAMRHLALHKCLYCKDDSIMLVRSVHVATKAIRSSRLLLYKVCSEDHHQRSRPDGCFLVCRRGTSGRRTDPNPSSCHQVVMRQRYFADKRRPQQGVECHQMVF